jgi:hypothetical protein
MLGARRTFEGYISDRAVQTDEVRALTMSMEQLGTKHTSNEPFSQYRNDTHRAVGPPSNERLARLGRLVVPE